MKIIVDIPEIYRDNYKSVYNGSLKAAEILNAIINNGTEVKQSKWIIYTDCEGKTRTCTCNLCGYETGKHTWENPNYCPDCGAEMVGDTDGTEIHN